MILKLNGSVRWCMTRTEAGWTCPRLLLPFFLLLLPHSRFFLNARSSGTAIEKFQSPHVPTLQPFIERKGCCTFIERTCGPTSCAAHHHSSYDLDQQPTYTYDEAAAEAVARTSSPYTYSMRRRPRRRRGPAAHIHIQ